MLSQRDESELPRLKLEAQILMRCWNGCLSLRVPDQKIVVKGQAVFKEIAFELRLRDLEASVPASEALPLSPFCEPSP